MEKDTGKNTNFLMDCIADALVLLMQTRPLEKITAQQVTELAGVGRATFFRRFGSKSEVLTYKLCRLWEDWSTEHNLNDMSEFSLLTIKDFFEFNLQYKNLLLKIYDAGMQNTIYEAFYRTMEPTELSDPMHRYANRFFSYGAFGLLDEWIKSGFKETPDEMTQIVINDIVGGNRFMS